MAGCVVAFLWVAGDSIAAAFPGAEERVLGVVYSVPGGAVGLTALRLLSGAASSVVRALNPFHGAGDALRLTPFAVRVKECALTTLASLVDGGVFVLTFVLLLLSFVCMDGFQRHGTSNFPVRPRVWDIDV